MKPRSIEVKINGFTSTTVYQEVHLDDSGHVLRLYKEDPQDRSRRLVMAIPYHNIQWWREREA